MKKKELKKKLSLNRETLSNLQESALGPVAGGATTCNEWTCQFATCTATVTTGCGGGCLC